jgi:Uma2 family endonuclease
VLKIERILERPATGYEGSMSTHDSLHAPVHPVVPVPTAESELLPSGLPLDRLYRFSVDEYRQMGAKGILNDDDRVELIEGIVVTMSPKSIAHRFAVDALLAILPGMLGQEWYPSGQNPLQLSTSEPEPDVAILRGTYRDYRNRHPEAKDAGLVIEVAESSLHYDRRTKGFLYSKHEVPEYWIVNLLDECVEINRAKPGMPQHFLPAQTFAIGSEAPLVIAGRQYGSIRVADLIAGADNK